MASLLWKDVLWPGEWTFAGNRKLKLKAADIRNARDEGKRMLKAGLDIPWCWEHQPDAAPVELSAVTYASPSARAAWARNTLDYVKDYKVENVPGRGPVLFAAIDKSRLSATDIDALQKCGKVSCRVDSNFVDARGKGTAYRGFTVGHIAITPRPVEPDQGPFHMSRTSEETFYMGAAVAEKTNDDEDKKGDDAPPAESTEAASDAPVAPEGNSDLTAVAEALRSIGLNIPDEVADFPGLVIAIKAGGAPQPAGDPASLGGENGQTTTSAANPPMMMSQADMQAQRPHIVKSDRREIGQRIDELLKTGRVSPPVAKKLKNEFESFELSYTGGEVAVTGIVASLKAYEALPEGMVMKPTAGFDLSATNAVNAPGQFTGQEDKTKADAIASDIAERTKRLMPARLTGASK